MALSDFRTQTLMECSPSVTNCISDAVAKLVQQLNTVEAEPAPPPEGSEEPPCVAPPTNAQLWVLASRVALLTTGNVASYYEWKTLFH